MSAAVRTTAGGEIRRTLALIVSTTLVAVLTSVAPAWASAPALVITAVAGSGGAGTAVPGPALGTHLGSPDGLAVDAAGDLYIADASGNVIEKVTPAGVLSIVAGTGTSGPPTAGPATGSRLNAPAGVAVDGNGNLYIADTGNHEVERVTPDGQLSIIAGTGTAGAPAVGPAISSRLGGPRGLALDAAGDLYIADGSGASGNPYVEKVTPAGGLSILAGSGTRGLPVAGPAVSSPLKSPTGVAVDPSGNVYIADAAANVVVKVSATGALSLFAGKSTGGAGAPAAGTATSSHLSAPTGLAADAAGDVYIADAANNRLEEVTPADQLSVLAGSGVAARPGYGSVATASPLDDPLAVTVNPAGAIFVADAGSATADRLAPGAPVDLTAPSVSGTAGQGQTLTADPGTWTNAPTAYSYQWQDCDAAGGNCAAIAGATAATQTLDAGDVGHTIRVVVTAANAGGATALSSAATSVVLPIAPVNTSAPTITGTVIDAQTLTAATGVWANAPTAYRYQWQDCNASGAACTTIGGATASTYTLQGSDLGDTVRVIVKATNATGSVSATSAPTGVVAPALVPWANVDPPTAIIGPVISGTAVIGNTLACSPGLWSGDPTQYAYQWNRSNAPIAGATNATYTVGAADRNHHLSCTVTAVNGGGEILAESAPVTVIVPAGPICPSAGGRVTATKLGPLSLGETRAQARRLIPGYAARARADEFCQAGGHGITAAYAGSSPSASIARAHRPQPSDRITVVLTDNRHYDLEGVHPGARIGRAPHRLRAGQALRVGAVRWYVFRLGRARGLLEVHGGRVRAVGIAGASVTAGRGAQRRLLTGLSG